jgi:hypothetical protein
MSLLSRLEIQKRQISKSRPKIELTSPCNKKNGICQFPEMAPKEIERIHKTIQNNSCYFIPSSGSGSRMFAFLYDFFNQSCEESRTKVERFLNNLDAFAFHRFIPKNVLDEFQSGSISLKDFASYIIDKDGLGFGNLPKGLIPFHAYEYFSLNPFQEHVLQAMNPYFPINHIQFTINENYNAAIEHSIEIVKQLSGNNINVDFTFQDSESDSYVFDSSGNVVMNEDGNYLRRPSGHGALLQNLNNIKHRYVFVKNIDNIQHATKNEAQNIFAKLAVLLVQFNEKIEQLLHSNTTNFQEELTELNAKYHLFYDLNQAPQTIEALKKWSEKPKRICGMVRNDGQPGGGPFWVNKRGVTSKQIVEKAQISNDNQQLMTMIQSTYFNPVMMVLDTFNIAGEKIDLNQYCDDESYMIVEKNHQGQKVQFIEKPGLWNGGMADWISIFVEIPTGSFSPVKDVLNLLDDKHSV